ncbi:GtrA family protein [uncultured Celeribacter sp.]|uniref:GtrA family protein n=1 Tax=uncultured Celeribacter sp. TaxID=1303376 RepID=UPI002AA6EE18|nr:GtrA family protein [uncultured Celeribacter sp.]
MSGSKHTLPLGTLVLRYAGFAVIATVVNLGVQRLVLDLFPRGLVLAMLVGTGLGLIVKYLLDKRWIFYDSTSGIGSHGRKFSLYTGMGLITTLIFWGMESCAWAIWRTTTAREFGAVVGLCIGYVVKFQLDRRYVFSGA